MAKFRVYFYYEEGGVTEVEANSLEEAEAKVYDELETDGLDNMEYECVHREYNTTHVEEAKDAV